MNTKRKMKRTLDVTLEVDENFNCVTVLDPQSGSCYTLDFERGRQPEHLMMRVGMEIWSWVSLMRDEFDLGEGVEE